MIAGRTIAPLGSGLVSRLVVKRLDSLDALRRAAPAWDELWRRSENTLPTARAELVALWCECFAPRQRFTAFVVEDGGRLVAALPLVERRKAGIRFGALPGNAWSPAGDLLLDPHGDALAVCESLLSACRQSRWPLLWFDAVASGADRWQSFLSACRRTGRAVVTRHRFAIDLAHVQGDWTKYLDSLSRNHRRDLRKSRAHAEQLAPTKLARYDDLSPPQVEPLLRRCFEIEASGWKGHAESAVLSVPGTWEFFLRQACQLAAWGQLSLTVLEHAGRPIAFEYGWRAKGVCSALKVGYDESFAGLSPGQLLRFVLYQQLHAETSVKWVDFLGPSTDATSKWATHDYAMDRVVVSTGGGLGRALVGVYRHGGPLLRCFRRRARDAKAARSRIGQPASAVPTEPELALLPEA